MIDILSWDLSTATNRLILTLVSKSPAHHVCLLRASLHAWVHHDIVLLDNSDSVLRIVALLSPCHRSCVILLGLNHVSSKHLRVLDLNLRVVEDVIVVIIDVLDDLYWLILTLLLGLRRPCSSLVLIVHRMALSLVTACYELVWLVTRVVTSVSSIGPATSWALAGRHIALDILCLFLNLSLIPFLVVLVDNFSEIVHDVIFLVIPL